MRNSAKAVAVMFVLGMVAGTTPAPAQQTDPTASTAPDGIYMPFVWNGNALDQKILDAQAEMIAPHRAVRLHRHHRHAAR
jgi:hypothetical protein